jgi:hypothetical protein
MKKIFGLMSLFVLLGVGSYAYAHVTNSITPDHVAVGDALTLEGIADIDTNGVFAAVLYSFYEGHTKVFDGCVAAPTNEFSETSATTNNNDVPFSVTLDTSGLSTEKTYRLYWKPQASVDCEEETVPSIEKREDYAKNVTTLQCPTGTHPESREVSPAVPAVDDVVIHHEAVYEDEKICKRVDNGSFLGRNCKIPVPSVFRGEGRKFDWVPTGKKILVKEAYDETIPGSPEIPAKYETVCVPNGSEVDPDPDPEPQPEPRRGGGGKCLNCDDKTPSLEEEKEEVLEEETLEEEVLEEEVVIKPTPVANACPIMLKGFIKLGEANDPSDVFVLQYFLNKYENAGLKYTGIYTNADFAAVRAFQEKYYDSVISPWHTFLPGMKSTGYVYVTTRHQINKILCPEKVGPFPVLTM